MMDRCVQVMIHAGTVVSSVPHYLGFFLTDSKNKTFNNLNIEI